MLKKALQYLATVAAMLAVLFVADRFDDPAETPRRPIPERAPTAPTAPPAAMGVLEAPSPDLPNLAVAPAGPRSDVSGTAFPAGAYGWFMTARHVVANCDQVGIVTQTGQIETTSRLFLSRQADIALMRMPFFPQPLAVEEPVLRYGQSGFGFGFPGGKWGQLHGLLLGRARLHVRGQTGSSQDVIMWSIRDTRPAGIASFRGISGGPMLDMAGTVIGTQVGSLPRRGRIVTSAPTNVNAMMKANRLEEESTGASKSGIEDLDAEHYARAGEKLRAQGRVVLVFCDVKEDKGLMILN